MQENHTKPQTAGLKQRKKRLLSAIFRVERGISPRSADGSASHQFGKPRAHRNAQVGGCAVLLRGKEKVAAWVGVVLNFHETGHK
jgi:hypothetical protein